MKNFSLGHSFLNLDDMSFYNINNNFNNKSYKFIAYFGILCKLRNTRNIRLPLSNSQGKLTKYKLLLDCVNNPYLLSPPVHTKQNTKISKFARIYANLLVWLYQHFYFGLYLFSKLSFNLFPNATEATDVFCEITGFDKQNILCLPRSIFAATTSKRFKNHGGMFIGVHFPSRHLHAWVIEDKRNAWKLDSMWINYTPVSVML